MQAKNPPITGQIRKGLRDAQYTVVASRCQPQLFSCVGEQASRLGIKFDQFFKQSTGKLRIAARTPIFGQGCETPRLTRPRLANTGRNLCACLRSEEHTSELQSRENLVCRLLLEK